MIAKYKVEKWIQQSHELGEGIKVSPNGGIVWWVDILRNKIYAKAIESNHIFSFSGIEEPSCIVNCSDVEAWVAAQNGLYKVSRLFNTSELLVSFPENNQRSNDAAVSPDGTYWISRMDRDEVLNNGEINRITLDDGKIEVIISGLGVPNTLIFDSKNKRFIFGDSKKGSLSTVALSPLLKLTGSPTVFIDEAQAPGVPDGSCLDSLGNLWNCRWGGSCVCVFDSSGASIATIKLPTRYPTSCCFISETVLLITTAKGSDPIDINPLAGHILKVTLL